MDDKRIIGIDYGTKRVGVAVSDPTGKLALPVDTLENTSDLVGKVMGLAQQYGSKTVVLGESMNYDGQPNAIYAAAALFKTNLESAGFNVIFEPEFMTSVQAERLQGKNDMNDASAAALILQSYMDKKNSE